MLHAAVMMPVVDSRAVASLGVACLRLRWRCADSCRTADLGATGHSVVGRSDIGFGAAVGSAAGRSADSCRTAVIV